MESLKSPITEKHYCDPWDRIEALIRHYGFTSVSSFAREIGLPRGENLYQIKRGAIGISPELAELITKKIPEVTKSWLLTGETSTGTKEAVRKPDITIECQIKIRYNR